MRQSLLSRLAKRAFRQGQVGQTIVIMAFGFIVLLAFVGIVTDVSLMFVRYSTLRRAVDAAAVAAAGQVRRTVPTDAEKTQAIAAGNINKANGYAFARNITNINLAARQFIEFYGLSPSNVVVDSCDTIELDQLAVDVNNKSTYNAALAELLQCTNKDQPRKLVQVTAQLASPTVFLRLIGWGTVTLEASAISETAVLDVVLIFDAAESMLKQTTYNDWKTVPITDGNGNATFNSSGALLTKDQSMRYLPIRVNTGPNWNYKDALYVKWAPASVDYAKAWRTLLTYTQKQINDFGTTNATDFPQVAFTWNGTTATQVTDANDPRHVRQDCRVRFFPFTDTVGPRAMTWLDSSIQYDLAKSYTALLRTKGILSSSEYYNTNMASSDYSTARFDGFQPAYDFYGCCNDPNGDMKFDDLICQPFQKVRQATEKFLDRVDFVRGDRVAFVTFDQTAYLIDPDGPTGIQLPMITSQENALTALRRIVGVRAEPTYYADTTNDGAWDAFVKGGTPYTGALGGGVPLTYDGTYNFTTKAYDLGGFNYTPLGTLNNYPVRYDCIYNNATLQYPYSIYSSQASQTDNTTYFGTQLFYPYEATVAVTPKRWPTPLAAMVGNAGMNPNLNLTAWDNSMKASTLNPGWSANKLARQAAKPTYSYEFRAACGGNNVGAALRVGNNALLDPRTVRIGNTGAVWVMVLLGDGAASASDPVQRNGGIINKGSPYNGPTLDPVPGDYGIFGLCPYGAPEDQSGLTAGWFSRPPRCSDDGSEPSNGGTRGYAGPVSRHTCTASSVGDNNNATIDLGKVNCEGKYDVDDYARDWADFIGLTSLPAISPFKNLPDASSSRSLLQLPTIFTIGFGLEFPEGSGCAGGTPTSNLSFTNINDCLGEELLRYIADVGDNNRIDTDYQQDYLSDGIIDGNTPDGLFKYGDRGPCEGPILSYPNAEAAAAGGLFSGGNFDPLKYNAFTYGDSCGNYYNAPNGAALTKVFEDIASRMFTRITK